MEELFDKMMIDDDELDETTDHLSTLSINDKKDTKSNDKKDTTFMGVKEQRDFQLQQNRSIKSCDYTLNYVTDFLCALDTKDLILILDSYESAKSLGETLKFIITQLDNIPWRISCEYYAEEENIHWMNCWIKIGWWDPDEYELSPELALDKWKICYLPVGIPNEAFRTVVWQGFGHQTLIKLMEAKKKFQHFTIPIELEFKDGFWIPIDFGMAGEKRDDTVIRFAKIEIGSLDKTHEFDLDKMRTLKKEVFLGPREKLSFYHGCNIGDYIVEDDDKEYEIELIEWDDDPQEFDLF